MTDAEDRPARFGGAPVTAREFGVRRADTCRGRTPRTRKDSRMRPRLIALYVCAAAVAGMVASASASAATWIR